MSEVAWKQCYNKGCLKKYKEEEDSEGEGEARQNILLPLTSSPPPLSLSLSPSVFPGVCVHHPGVPVFHDAMKVRRATVTVSGVLMFVFLFVQGWSCCKKRSTDFTDFLNIPVSPSHSVY